MTTELDGAIAALEAWHFGDDNPIPPASAQLTPATEQTRQWERVLTTHARALMPAEIDSVEPKRALPGWFSPWRGLRPQEGFIDALKKASDPIVEVLDDVEADHKSILREIERAREVVSFSIQTASEERDTDDSLAKESIGNARGLLAHSRETLPERSSAVEAAFVQATASTFYQYHLAFEQGRISLLSYLAREGVARGSQRVSHVVLEQGRRFSLEAWRRIERYDHMVRVRIGLEAPVEADVVPVQRWQVLGDGFDVGGSAAQRLPLIYGRLFRGEPVEDLRFLVGRETEMAALTDARTLWEGGRFAAVLIAGQRGSGKTSLINCSLSRSFSDADVVRGRFIERILTPHGVRSFLSELLGVSNEDLLHTLKTERRVVVIEEVERTFLRRVGGFQALEELLEIVTATARSTLWILSLAGEAFNLLNAAAGVGSHFSHRINASSVKPEHVREAILQRHNLSGLRLEFAVPPQGNRLWTWFHRQTGIQESPETAFFDDLYRRSGGVFRSAFGFWQQHIDRAEGGVLYMLAPDEVDHDAVSEGLSRFELFTLQAILQHGSLTPEQHAEVFGIEPETSRAVVEHLFGCHILEDEPEATGARIRPAALMLVRSMLSLQNLM